MSGFDRALGALDRREMLECARGLLRALAGEAGVSFAAAASGGAGGIDGEAGRFGGRGDFHGGGAGAFEYGVRDLAEAGRAGRDVRRSRGGERTRRGGFSDETGNAETAREDAGAPNGAKRQERETFRLSRGKELAEHGDFDGSGGAGAAFAGPERRYENAVGARGMEMSRVSDYFRRDSRRYDAGFTRY